MERGSCRIVKGLSRMGEWGGIEGVRDVGRDDPGLLFALQFVLQAQDAGPLPVGDIVWLEKCA